MTALVPARRLAPVALLAAAATVLVLAPAAAHPAFQEGAAPARSLATVALDLGHGCTAEEDGHPDGDAGTEAPTSHVALEIPEVVTHVEPHPVDGWIVDVEEQDGRIVVVTWTDDGGAEPAPTFDLDLVVDADAGDEVWFKVVQACDDVMERWIGTPDEPADDPAALLRLTAPDPDAPAPAPAEAEEPSDEEEAAPPTEPTEEDPVEELHEEPEVTPDEAAAPDDGAAGSARPLLWLAALGAAVVAVGSVLWRRRAGSETP